MTQKKKVSESNDILGAVAEKCKGCQGICTEACPLYVFKGKYDENEKLRRRIIGHWLSAYSAKYGKKYAMTPAEQKAAKQLVEVCGDEETAKMTIAGFMEDDFWTSPRIGLLVKHTNRYMPVKRSGTSYALQVKAIMREINGKDATL